MSMEQKWQQALSRWDAWVKSIKEARTSIEKQYGDFSQLVARSEFKFEEEQTPDGSRLFIKTNTEAMILWKLYDVIKKMGSSFILQEIGLPARSIQYHLFLNYWMKSAFPEATQDTVPDLDIVDGEPPAWFERKVVKRNKQNRVVDTVSWYPDEVDSIKVAKSMLKTKFPSNVELVLEKAKGGRPQISRESTIYPEAVVCTLLKEKQKLTYKQIANIFGWAIQENEHGAPSTSNTVASRIKIGKRLLRFHK